MPKGSSNHLPWAAGNPNSLNFEAIVMMFFCNNLAILSQFEK
jgi:hypothetical protein